VSFAGRVGGVRYVVVRTSDGVLVTHGYLLDIGVTIGDRVHRGDRVGYGTDRLFIGVRVGGRYVDPGGGWCRGGERRPRAVLVG
jgi:septal ring factor EnvC (AmiA/AmiB activator)